MSHHFNPPKWCHCIHIYQHSEQRLSFLKPSPVRHMHLQDFFKIFFFLKYPQHPTWGSNSQSQGPARVLQPASVPSIFKYTDTETLSHCFISHAGVSSCKSVTCKSFIKFSNCTFLYSLEITRLVTQK